MDGVASPNSGSPTGQWYRPLLEGLNQLALVWDEIAYQCGNKLDPTSPCALEATCYGAWFNDPEVRARDVAVQAATFMTAANQVLRSLGVLVESGPALVITGWGVVRTLTEYCGRAVWLLDNDITARERLARVYLEKLEGVHWAQKTAKATKIKAELDYCRGKQQQLVDEVKQVFPNAEIDTASGSTRWVIDGQSYKGLSHTTNRLGKKRLATNGLYDLLSSYTHPSLSRLNRQTRTTLLADRTYRVFVTEAEVVLAQLVLACSAVWASAYHVTSYLNLDESALNDWEDSYPDLTHWQPPENNSS